MKLELYSYWRSSSSWRVRIALALKGLDYTYHAVPLLEAAHLTDAHLNRNPMGQIPVLTVDGTPVSQSMAILDLLEHLAPTPSLLPDAPLKRAQAIALAETVNAGIQPAQNLALLVEIEALAGAAARKAWGRKWIDKGLAAFEASLAATAGEFCVGDAVSWADICLIPQLYNARRFGCDLSGLPRVLAVESRCAALPAFVAAHPDQQPDAPGQA